MANVLQVRLALCQLKTTDNKMKNIENASKAVQVNFVLKIEYLQANIGN